MRKLLLVPVMLALTTPAMAGDIIRGAVYKDVDSLIQAGRIFSREGLSKDQLSILMLPLVACVPDKDTPVVHNAEKDVTVTILRKPVKAVHVTVIAGDDIDCRGYVPEVHFHYQD